MACPGSWRSRKDRAKTRTKTGARLRSKNKDWNLNRTNRKKSKQANICNGEVVRIQCQVSWWLWFDRSFRKFLIIVKIWFSCPSTSDWRLRMFFFSFSSKKIIKTPDVSERVPVKEKHTSKKRSSTYKLCFSFRILQVALISKKCRLFPLATIW